MDGIAPGGHEWDVVVVGTGMGGATLGHALSQAGWRVLFCEMGRSALPNAPALRVVYPETRFSATEVSEAELLCAGGRCSQVIEDLSGDKPKRFVPFIGSGTGGSSALYGMILERFFPADFEPARHYPYAFDSALPQHWPIRYADLAPFYEAAERLYGVRGERDPLRAEVPLSVLASSPPMSGAARELADEFKHRGMHPYQLPQACEYTPGCRGCQGFLCGAACKNDSARVCLEPALTKYGARLLDECEVVKVEASREHVTGLVCRRGGEEFRVKARVFVLAAGALATPSLLLRSINADWPDGVANRSGQVGRNLMRHYIDLYAVFPKLRPERGGNAKEFGCNDLYMAGDTKLGAIQSFGKLPPGSMIADELQRDLRENLHSAIASAFSLVKPLMRPIFDCVFSRALVVATIVEDLPYADNRVLPPGNEPPGGIAIRYRVHSAEADRIKLMRLRMKSLLPRFRYLLIKQAENNQRIAHACGTCRSGVDPATSVVDANNRAHDLANLYIVDASFFPSSGGTNPALTIAANALRVADHLLGRLMPRVKV